MLFLRFFWLGKQGGMLMRLLIVILCLATIAMASEFIPFQDIQQLAERFVDQRFGDHYFESSIIYYGYDEQPNAYAMIFRNHDNMPLTIVMGARYTSSPVGEIIQALPRCQSQSEKLTNIINRQGMAMPRFVQNYYFGPGEEYCGFISQNGEYLINTGTYKIIEKDMLIGRQPVPDPELEKLTREKWNKYFKCDNFASRDSNYVPGVPWIDWVYGCLPTAASMLFWYWDSRGYGRLVDYFYLHWDYPEGEWNDCANVNRELALAMYTDSMTGGTTINNIRNGMITTANSYNGYSFSGSTSPQGGSYNQWNFTWVRREIDAARPFHWHVLYYYYSGQFITNSSTGD